MRETSLTAARVAIDVTLTPGLAADIDAAAEAADPRHHFLRRAWFAAAGGSGVTTLVARRPDGRTLAALPTRCVGPAALGLRSVPGCYWPFRSFPIAADAEDAEIAALLSHPIARRALGRAWRLGPINADDPTGLRLAHIARASGWSLLERRIATSYGLDIAALRADGAWPRTSTLQKNRWYERRLGRSGELQWRFVSGGDWTPAIFDQLAAIEAKSWVAKRGGDAKFLSSHRRIWEAALADPALASMLNVNILSIGGAPVAFEFGIETGATAFAIANSYDEAFAQHSPGRVLVYRSFAAAMERGVERIDWGAGDSGYKSTMGARPGPDIVDWLFVRGPTLARFIRPFWTRSGR
ncbi:GNAT family N-acetyltransferase [Enterovirga sp. GCM10030262]|uniref:GNAT family N-acetyltransferase n=1 Tax=Enterovirga sp. GCM10030262 TaxID=3273391 RepID=UPI00361C7A50